MARSTGTRMFVAVETFVRDIDGEIHFVTRDKTRVREGDPLLVGCEEHFREIDDYPDVEQATAGPGERRGGRQAAAASA